MRPDIQEMFDNLNKKHFNGEVPPVRVVWNGRMTTTAGYCRYRGRKRDIHPYQIDLSIQLFRNNNWDGGKIERTLVHEMVHAFLIHKYGEKGHTARFQNMMVEITGEYKNHRCHNYDVEGLKRTQEKKFFWSCVDCGNNGKRVRPPMPNRNYYCASCRGVVKITRIKLEQPRAVKIF